MIQFDEHIFEMGWNHQLARAATLHRNRYHLANQKRSTASMTRWSNSLWLKRTLWILFRSVGCRPSPWNLKFVKVLDTCFRSQFVFFFVVYTNSMVFWFQTWERQKMQLVILSCCGLLMDSEMELVMALPNWPVACFVARSCEMKLRGITFRTSKEINHATPIDCTYYTSAGTYTSGWVLF